MNEKQVTTKRDKMIGFMATAELKSKLWQEAASRGETLSTFIYRLLTDAMTPPGGVAPDN